MVPLPSLMLPIILSAVIVFVASSIIHMVLRYHRNDVRAVPDEDAAQQALRPLNLPPGDYALPYAGGPAGLKDPRFVERMERGPVALLTVAPPGAMAMGRSLVLWFLYSVLVSLMAAYLAGRTLPPGTDYLEVFRVVGTAALMGYSLALLQNSIWFWRNWGWTLRGMFDGLVYALLTAGTFGWLWPR